MQALNITMQKGGGFHVGTLDIRDRIVFPGSDYVMTSGPVKVDNTYREYCLYNKNDMTDRLVRFTGVSYVTELSDNKVRIGDIMDGLDTVRTIAHGKLDELQEIRKRAENLDVSYGIDIVANPEDKISYDLGDGLRIDMIHPWDAANYWGFSAYSSRSQSLDVEYAGQGNLKRNPCVSSDWVEVDSGTLKDALLGYLDRQIGLYGNICREINPEKEAEAEKGKSDPPPFTKQVLAENAKNDQSGNDVQRDSGDLGDA